MTAARVMRLWRALTRPRPIPPVPLPVEPFIQTGVCQECMRYVSIPQPVFPCAVEAQRGPMLAEIPDE